MVHDNYLHPKAKFNFRQEKLFKYKWNLIWFLCVDICARRLLNIYARAVTFCACFMLIRLYNSITQMEYLSTFSFSLWKVYEWIAQTHIENSPTIMHSQKNSVTINSLLFCYLNSTGDEI